MTLKNRVRILLENEPKARELSNRYRTVWYILYDIYHKDVIDKQMFLEVGPMIITITREIRQLQEHNETLRGTDYEKGKILAQEKQLNLGYEPGYHARKKFINKITS